MHEATVAKYAFDIIKETSNRKVTRVTFGMGKPNTVMQDSFEFYFMELIKGTNIDGAKFVYKDSDEEGFFVSSIEVEDGD